MHGLEPAKSVRVFFAGGGTGGHLYPGLAIARALVKARNDIAPFFIGARRGIERDILPTTEFPFALLELHPLYRSAPWKNVTTLRGMIAAWSDISRLARVQRPALVVGTGGYAAGAALAWARMNRVPYVVHEPDSHPGLTTRVFAPSAAGVFLGFPEAAEKLRTRAGANVLALGAPIEAPPAVRRSRRDAQAEWGLPAGSFTVLVFGGSQGAKAINDVVAQWVRGGLPQGVSLIWATGKAQAASYLQYESERVRVRPYLSPIGDAYAAADLAITRAGAMSIAELCAWQVPAILVPLPTAAQDHQSYNARAVASSGAAIHLPQNELDAEALTAHVTELQARPEVLEAMRQATQVRARPNAATDIAKALLRLMHENHFE